MNALVCCQGGNSSEHTLNVVTGLFVVIAIVMVGGGLLWWRVTGRRNRSDE